MSERPTDVELAFVAGAARAMFVTAWADKQEERGHTYPGQELMDVAPKTPRYAILRAWQLMGRMEAINNGYEIHALIAAARRADKLGEEFDEEYCRLFGHYYAMQSLGHGVSWFDDHEPLDLLYGATLQFPHIEFII